MQSWVMPATEVLNTREPPGRAAGHEWPEKYRRAIVSRPIRPLGRRAGVSFKEGWTMPKKPCARPGCNRLVSIGQSYCASHTTSEQAERSVRSDVGRTASDSRKWYKRAAWSGKYGRRLRQLGAEPLCRMCPDWSKQPATIADHMVPHRGDHALFWFGELQSLCKSCHDIKKQRLERRMAPRGGSQNSGIAVARDRRG
jgi:5-methylcytosine-specific restriction protein A